MLARRPLIREHYAFVLLMVFPNVYLENSSFRRNAEHNQYLPTLLIEERLSLLIFYSFLQCVFCNKHFN